MPTSLTRPDHLGALQHHGAALAERARAAGLDAAVPSCPGWTVAHLVAHVAMVHRWATGKVRAERSTPFRDDEHIRAMEPDLIGYYAEGHRALVAALEEAPADLDASVFLLDAPAPREFWARRQAHETTIHAVDALAAALGRLPSADEVGVGTPFAIDGLDELVSGFLPRNASEMFRGERYVIQVCPEDADRAWSIIVGPELATSEGLAEPPAASEGLAEPPAATFGGTSAQLYLGMWNRGDEIEVDGDPDVLTRWRAAERISWG